MYGYRTFLKIGDIKEIDFMSLLKNGYELSNFSYSLVQPADEQGKAQGEVQGGTLQLTFSGFPTDELLDWMINPRRYKDGVIITYGENSASVMRVFFKKAICIDMNIDYNKSSSQYISVQFIISAENMNIGGHDIENKWKNA